MSREKMHNSDLTFVVSRRNESYMITQMSVFIRISSSRIFKLLVTEMLLKVLWKEVDEESWWHQHCQTQQILLFTETVTVLKDYNFSHLFSIFIPLEQNQTYYYPPFIQTVSRMLFVYIPYYY